LITNYLQIAESLPAKTVPRRSNAAHQTRTKTLSVKQKKRKDRSDSLGSPNARTAPSGSKKSRVTVEEVEDKEDIGPSQSTLTPPDASSSSTTQIPKVWLFGPNLLCLYLFCFQASTRTNPIYLFYESVALNANKLPGELGDKHYKCYHGNRKILTITRKMRSSLNGAYQILPRMFVLLMSTDRPYWSP
jgi:hypothetical protein